ncbi:MAG: alpha/beta hydrolase [Candidatus Lokiarchaeota archaeon]|nr:alpha/beta hydrolase [Candidatus Lokiarchaeota archaeon]
MPKVKANNIELEYDTFGDSTSEPLLLINGLGSQLIRWPEEFCEMFVKKGFYLVRFDNRDVGLSTKFEHLGIPNSKEAKNYAIDDMADDAVGLLDALGIEKAHICGISMGAAITQTIGYRHPDSVLSLTLIAGTTGNPDLPSGKSKMLRLLLTPAPTDREANIEFWAKFRRNLNGTGFPYDENKERELSARCYDRKFYPQGKARQLWATLAQGNRKPKLSSISVPTVVIHGRDDPLFPYAAGKDIADSIPGSEFVLIDGMGHSFPPETWPTIVNAIRKNADKSKTIVISKH